MKNIKKFFSWVLIFGLVLNTIGFTSVCSSAPFIESFTETFDTDTGIWYSDEGLTEGAQLNVANSRAEFSVGDEIYAELLPKIGGEPGNDEEYWVGIDGLYTGAVTGFSGLKIGDGYLFGIKNNGEGVYPYAAYGSADSSQVTDIIEGTAADRDKVYELNNMELKTVAASFGTFTNDLTRLRPTAYGDASVVFKKNGLNEIKLIYYRMKGIKETIIPQISVSSDLSDWSVLSASIEAKESVQYYNSYEVTASIPSGAGYVKIVMPQPYLDSGAETGYWNHDIARVELGYLVQGDLIYEMGSTGLRENVLYSLALRISNKDNKVTLYTMREGVLVGESTAVFTKELKTVQNKIGIVNEGTQSNLIDNVVVEKFNEEATSCYCTAYRNAEENRMNKGVLTAAKTVVSQIAEGGVMRTTCLAVINKCLAEIDELEADIDSLLSSEISEANIEEKYVIYTSIKERISKIANYQGEYDEALQIIDKKLERFNIYINGFGEEFDTGDRAWYSDYSLTEPIVPETGDSKVNIYGNAELYTRLEPVIAEGTGTDEDYWTALDFSYSGEITDFAGLRFGSDYKFGVKNKGSRVYPYASYGAAENGIISTTVLDCTEEDADYVYEMNNMEYRLETAVEGTFTDDLTRLRPRSKGDGYIIYKTENIKDIRVVSQRAKGMADEVQPKLFASSDLSTWTALNATPRLTGTVTWYNAYETSPESIPDGTKYIKVLLPAAYMSDNTPTDYWNQKISRVEIDFNETEKCDYEVYGNIALDENTDYSLVLRISYKDNATTIYLVKDFVAQGENTIVFTQKRTEAIDRIGLVNYGSGSFKVDRVRVEKTDSSTKAEYCSAYSVAEKKKTEQNIQNAIAITENAPYGIMRDTQLKLLNMYQRQNRQLINSINELCQTEITVENARSEYKKYEEVLKQIEPLDDYKGVYAQTLEDIADKFVGYELYLNRFESDFESGDTPWYTDKECEIPAEIVSVGGMIKVNNGAQLHSELDDKLLQPSNSDEEYWVNLGYSFSGASDGGFAGIKLGEDYTFGIKENNGKVYTYVRYGEENRTELKTEVIECVDSDISGFFDASNIEFITATPNEGTIKNDLTRMRLMSDAPGYVVLNRNNIKNIRIISHRQIGIADELHSAVSASSELYSWENVDMEVREKSSAAYYAEYLQTSKSMPENTNYVKISLPVLYLTDGSYSGYWNYMIAKVELDCAADTEEIYEMYGDTPLNSDTDYSLALRISSKNNSATLYLLKDGKVVEQKSIDFTEALVNDIEKISVINNGMNTLLVNNICLERIDETTKKNYCEAFHTAEREGTMASIEAAQASISNAPKGLMWEVSTAMLNKLETENGAVKPSVTEISISGSLKENETVTATATVYDSTGVLDYVEYNWYINDKLVHSGSQYSIPTGIAGSDIRIEAVAVTVSGEKSEPCIFRDTVYAYIPPTNASAGGSGGGGGGGGVFLIGKSENNTANNEGALIQTPENKQDGFSDTIGHWASVEIEKMREMDILKGQSDGRFMPDAEIDRAAVATIISRLIEVEEEKSAEFTDVDDSSWYSEAVNSVFAAGIMNGDGGKFYPSRPITREEFAKVIAILCEKLGIEADTKLEPERTLTDISDISDWAKSYVEMCLEYGLITGYEDGSFRPSLRLTRAEAAMIFYRMMKCIDKI